MYVDMKNMLTTFLPTKKLKLNYTVKTVEPYELHWCPMSGRCCIVCLPTAHQSGNVYSAYSTQATGKFHFPLTPLPSNFLNLPLRKCVTVSDAFGCLSRNLRPCASVRHKGSQACVLDTYVSSYSVYSVQTKLPRQKGFFLEAPEPAIRRLIKALSQEFINTQSWILLQKIR